MDAHAHYHQSISVLAKLIFSALIARAALGLILPLAKNSIENYRFSIDF